MSVQEERASTSARHIHATATLLLAIGCAATTHWFVGMTASDRRSTSDRASTAGTEWTEVYRGTHPNLAFGVEWAVQERPVFSRAGTSIHPAETRTVLVVDGDEIRPTSLQEVRAWIGPISSLRLAESYTELLRELELPGSQVPGLPMSGPGRSGTQSDVEQQLVMHGVTFRSLRDARPNGYRLERPIVEHVRHDGMRHFYRVVMVREYVKTDGSYRFDYGAVLVEGRAAERYFRGAR